MAELKKELVKILEGLEQTGDVRKFNAEVFKLYGAKDPELANCLKESAEGDNRKLNNWFFSLPNDYSDYVPWLGKVKTKERSKYISFHGAFLSGFI